MAWHRSEPAPMADRAAATVLAAFEAAQDAG
jgi:hypothetical protein